MARFNSPLNNVKVAAPCNADWEQMIGNERARFCGQCNLNVYNLSSMSWSEAEHLIASNEGRLCVRFYRRRDGSIITENCPVGLRALKRRLSYVRKAVTSALLTFFAGVGIFEAASVVANRIAPQRTMGVMRMGDIYLPPVTPPPVTPSPPRTDFVMGRMAVPVGRKVKR